MADFGVEKPDLPSLRAGPSLSNGQKGETEMNKLKIKKTFLAVLSALQAAVRRALKGTRR